MVMKKVWMGFLGLALVGSFLCTGCDKDDPTPEPKTVVTWKLDKVSPVLVRVEKTDDPTLQATLQGALQGLIGGLLAGAVEDVTVSLNKSDNSLGIQWTKEGEEPVELSESLPSLQLKYKQTSDKFIVFTNKAVLGDIIGQFVTETHALAELSGILNYEEGEFSGMEFHWSEALGVDKINIYLEKETILQLLPIVLPLMPPVEGMPVSSLPSLLESAEKLQVGLCFIVE
jgi:hypothetical protein